MTLPRQVAWEVLTMVLKLRLNITCPGRFAEQARHGQPAQFAGHFCSKPQGSRHFALSNHWPCTFPALHDIQNASQRHARLSDMEKSLQKLPWELSASQAESDVQLQSHDLRT